MHTPEQLRLQLKQQQRRTRGLGLAHVAVYVAAVVLLLLRMEAPAMVLGAGNAILYFLFVRRLLTCYSQAVTNANLLCGLCQPLEEAWCTENTCMTEGEFEDLKLLPLRRGKGSSLMAHNGFAGTLGQLSVRGFEATFHYPYTTPSGKTSYRFLNGTLLVSRGQKKEGADWLLLHKGLLEEEAQQRFLEEQGYRAVSIAGTGLEEFFLFTTQESDQAPEDVCRHLELLARGTKNLGAVRLGPEVCAVFLVNRFYTRRVKVRELPEAQDLCVNPLPERDAVLALMRWWHKQ